MEDITEAIRNAEGDLTSVRERLFEAKELVALLEQDQRRMELELAGMRSYADRRGLLEDHSDQRAGNGVDAIGGADVVPISASIQLTREREDLAAMTRNEAVATILRTARAPMNRLAITEQAIEAGRFDSVDDISLSLSGLKRAGRVSKLGRGLWSLIEEPAPGATG